ncbi:MAG: permease-like cell division protein FtsX [Ignavibacteriales bacterium]|nr:permease-like cell division protein FtsX [Ignavibacteriales bacterium]
MILFYLKETLRIFRKSSFATIVTITITTIAVSLTTVSFFLVFSTNTLSNQVKRSIEVNVYLEDSLNSSDIENIRSSITQIHEVQSVLFISKNDAVKKFLAETGEDFRKVIDQNPLPNSLVVKFQPESLDEMNIEKFTDQFKKLKGVSDVVYDYKTVLRILNFLKSFKYIIYILSVILILLSIYLVYSNNKIQMYGNRNLYVTMKLVGALEKTMKIPLIINGLFIGLISSLFTLFLFHGILILLTKIYYNIKFIMYLDFLDILIPVIGVSLGFIGSFISSSKLSNLLQDK